MNAHSPLFKVYQMGQFRLARRNGQKWQAVVNPAWQHRNVRMLLAYLLHSSGRRRGREQIIEELWPEQDIENATNRLNNTVHAIRQLLEPELARPAMSRLLRLEADVLILADAGTIWSDTDAFIDLRARSHAASEAAQAVALIEEAVALYGGDFLQEERVSEWALAHREVMHRVWVGLLLELADHRMTKGELSRALDALQPLLASDPTNEAAVRRLMLALTQLQRRNEALQVYERLTSALDRMYGIVPLAETSRLNDAIRKGEIADWLPAQPHSGREAVQMTARRTTEEAKSISEGTPLLKRSALQQGQIGRSNQSPLVGR